MLYKKILGKDAVKVHFLETKKILEVLPKNFEKLSAIAFEEMRYFFSIKHLENWKTILDSSESSDSEKEKMERNIRAAVEAKNKRVPYCQDCGTDTAYIFRGDQTIVSSDIFREIQTGASEARQKNPFRNSVFVPKEDVLEKNSGDNSPCEVHFFDHLIDGEIAGIFSNKGGGSGSKLWNFSEKPSLYQDRDNLVDYLCQKIAEMGHSACPPYHLKIVLGGLSHLQNSQFLTLATVENYVWAKNPDLEVVRDKAMEEAILKRLKISNMGAQGEGKFFLMPDGLRIFRAPRHAAHFFIGMGVSCSAHRIQRFKINEDGVFLEELCKNPEQFLEKQKLLAVKKKQKEINLDDDLEIVLKVLRQIKSGEEFFVSGKILGARDKAHARWLQNFEKKGVIPDYLRQYLSVFYVGPSDTPKGEIIGSFGPTTASRMDEFSEFLGQQSVLPLSIAKGTRSKMFARNCKKYGMMFVAIQGGPASLLRNFVKSQKVIDFEDLGMEAVRLYEVERMPVQMIVDAKGNDFYQELADDFFSPLFVHGIE